MSPSEGVAERRRAWVGNALLAVLSPVVFLALIEAGMRAFLHVPRFSLTSAAACTRPDFLLGYSFIPSCVGNFRGIDNRTNALGLRGPEVPDDGRRRILAIGDSCTWGYLLHEEESYPASLQRLLDEKVGPGRYRVINAGVPGYTSHHGVAYLSRRGLRLHPDVVLIAYEWNDGVRQGDVAARLESRRRLKAFIRLDHWLADRSELYRFLTWHLVAKPSPSRAPQVSLEQYRKNLATMVNLVRASGARPVLVSWSVWPEYEAVQDAVSRDLDVPLVRYYGPRLAGDVVHPTADGNRRLAAVLFDRLQAAGYFDGQ